MSESTSKRKASFHKRSRVAIETLERRELLTAVAFTVDPALSSLTVGGVIQTAAGNVSLTPQAVGSLTTMYSGTINADVEATSIQFSNSSSVTAENNGTWLPGSVAGNYGASAVTPAGTIPLAVRGLVAAGSSAALTLAPDGTFTSTGESLSLTAGELDYTFEGDSSKSLVGLSAINTTLTKSSYVVSSGQATLTLPFAVTYTTTVFTTNDTQLTLNGTVVATAPAPVISATSIFGAVHGPSVLANETIYIDSNNNGSFDLGEPSTTTDLSGNYTLSPLNAGNVIVRQILPGGFKQTSPGNGFGLHLSLAAGQMLTNENFVDIAVPGTISGTVHDSSAMGLGNVTIYLDINNNGKKDASEPKTTTNAAGGFMFSGMAAGPYIVRQILPVGYNQITPANGFGIHTTLVVGHAVTNANFSDALIGAPITGSISGEIFVDANGNGNLDNGETGLSNWELYIDLNNSHTLLPADPTTPTDTNGNFTFTGLAAGTYIIRTTQPPGWMQTVPATNFGRHITLSLGQNVFNTNFGELSDD